MKPNLKEMQDYKIQIIDFNDSFTQNIRSELHIHGLSSDVVNCNMLDSDFLTNDRGVIILGPGPGHPDDYQVLTHKFLDLFLGKRIST